MLGWQDNWQDDWQDDWQELRPALLVSSLEPDARAAALLRQVQWVGGDEAGRPVLTIRLGPALRACDSAAAVRFAEAVCARFSWVTVGGKGRVG